jgi:hypothetical protein
LRTTAGSALAALLIAGALAAPAPAATLHAPDRIAAREMLAVTATGLAPGRWAVFLTHNNFVGLPCEALLARRTARSGEPTVFSGIVPSALRCPPGVDALQVPAPPPPPDAPMPVEPGGGYRLILCGPDNGCRLVAARHPVQVVPTGRRCASVTFTPDSDHGAFNIRARNVTCAVARRVARRSEGGSLRYHRAGLRCRGIFDEAGLAQTVYRCSRPGARVTFASS